jgi:DNA polymerase-3 subunit delta'
LSNSTASRLEELIGLSSAKRLVLRLARGDLGTHAVLLYGVPGSGKQHLARLLAQAWLCQTPTSDGACGECRACLAFERGNASDFLMISPQGASRIIVSRQISEPPDKKPDDPIPLITFFRTLPVQARHRVGLIEDAHRMNRTTSNGLLKTLEEPHPHAKIILTTDSVGGVAPTILSRCLAVACELPSEEELDGIAAGASADVIRMASGAPGRVMDALKKPEVYGRIGDFGRSLYSRPAGGGLKASDEFRELSEALALQNASGARAANALALELLAVFLAREPGTPPAWTQAVIDAHRRIQGNASAPIVFDALFCQMLMERG